MSEYFHVASGLSQTKTSLTLEMAPHMKVMIVWLPQKNHGKYHLGKESMCYVLEIQVALLHGFSGLLRDFQDATSTLMDLQVLKLQKEDAEH